MKTKRMVAAEIFSSAVCNLNCKYCYIPKVKEMKELHFDLVEKIKNKTYIEQLYNLYGSDLEYLSLWGAEPTISLNYISKIIPDILERFKKLKQISFSTNFLTNTKIIKDFIKNFPKTKKIKIQIQISLDGPEEITGVNRMKNSAEKIKNNLIDVFDYFHNIDLGEIKLDFSYKPTLTIENIKYLNENYDNIYNYYKFFDDLDYMLLKYKHHNIKLPIGGGIITLEVPGNYTVEDGKIFAKLIKKISKIQKNNNFKIYKGMLTAYHYRLKRIIDYGKELFVKPNMFTCSGGDSNFGLGNNKLFMCHRGMFLSDKRYTNAVKNMKNNYDSILVKTGFIDRINKYYAPNINDDKELTRFLYVMHSRHNYSALRLSSVITLLNELVLANQALKKYFSKGEIKLIHLFLITAFDCPADFLNFTASVNIPNLSILRIMANGAFEIIKKDVGEYYG